MGGGGLYLTGQYIHVIADGPNVRAELRDSGVPGGGSLIGTPSGGPDLTGAAGQITVSSGAFLDPRYCDGTDLIYYTTKLTWPYADYHKSVDHPSCAVVVCDLEILTATVTNETASGQSDGQVALTSSSSNGTVKYSLIQDFDYATQGLDSPITGLPTGNYTVYAKDAAGCTDQVNVFVGQDFTYGPRWRMEYGRVFPRGARTVLDIEERDYSGSITEICGGAVPFLLRYEPRPDSQVVPSNAEIQILCETDAEFDDIRKGVDRQFRVRKYDGYGNLEWTGFISPEFYSEPYLDEPYIITLTAYDGLGELKNKAFKALSGEEYFGDMSLIQIIVECLKKIPVQINLRDCVNIYETTMDSGDEDDPLAQAFIQSQNFREMNCDEVLTSILKPFTEAELFQSFGKWWIRTKEQSVYSTLAYREFDMDAEFVESGTISSRKTVGKEADFIWDSSSQVLSFSRPYGTFRVLHDLGRDNNMIDSGSFEETDIDPAQNFFRGWTIFPGQVNTSYGLEFVKNGDSKGAFFFQWQGTSGTQADTVLTTKQMPVTFPGFASTTTKFNLKFQVYVSRAYPVRWVRLGVRFRWIDTDSGDFWDMNLKNGITLTTSVNTESIQDFYVDRFNSWETIEVIGIPVIVSQLPANMALQVSLHFHNHNGRDFTTLDGLRDEPTLNTHPEGKRFYVTDGNQAPTYGVELQRNTEAEDAPNIIRPDDYNSSSNPRQWVKIDEYNQVPGTNFIDRLLIDNFEISIFSLGIIPGQPDTILIEPPPSATYDNEITTDNESTLEVEVENGDAPDLIGAEYVYNGYFKLSDGTPTALWARDGVDEETRLLSILLSHMTAQGTRSLRRLSGTGRQNIGLGYINSLEDTRDNTRYRFTRFELDDKAGQINCELEEVLTGDDGESPPDPGGEDGNFRITTDGDIRALTTGDLRVYVDG